LLDTVDCGLNGAADTKILSVVTSGSKISGLNFPNFGRLKNPIFRQILIKKYWLFSPKIGQAIIPLDKLLRQF